MFCSSSRFWFLILFISPVVLSFSSNFKARAEQDEVDDGSMNDNDDEAEIEDDEETAEVDDSIEDEAAVAEETVSLTAHPDTETAIVFSSGEEVELVAGKMFSSYLHFANTGSKNFIITSVTGSFRYPQDYSYVIQNFTDLPVNKMIDNGKEGSFIYQFMAAEMASGRPFGLVISINYKDTEDNLYQDTVFNKTVTVLENEEGVDAETFFLYVILTTLVGLAVFVVVHLITSKSKRRHVTSTKVIETGTSEGDVDFSWIPQETLNSINKGSPSSRSPRKRNSKRAPANEAE